MKSILKYSWSNAHCNQLKCTLRFLGGPGSRNIINCLRSCSTDVSGSQKSYQNTNTGYFDALNVSWKNFDRISKAKLENILHRVSKDKCNSEQGLLLLKCIAESLPEIVPQKKAELTLSAWKIIKNAGPITLEHYHVLLSSLSALHYPVIAEDILMEMKEDGLQPNDICYLKLLECVCEAGDIKQATKILTTIKDAGFSVNQTAFNAVIIGHGKSRDVAGIERTLQIMHDTGIEIGPETFTSVLRSFAEMGDELTFRKYFDEYKSELLDSQRLSIIKSLCASNMYNLVIEVLKYRTWIVNDIQKILIHTLIELAHTDNIDAALIIVKELRDCLPISSNSEATFALFLIQEMVKANTPLQKVIEVCDDLMEYNSFALLKATEIAIQYRSQKDAVEFLNVLASRGHQLRPHYFWPLIINAGENSGEVGVFEVLKIMLKMKIKPDHDTLTDWFFPRCNLLQPIQLVRKLQDHGLTVSHIHTPLLTSLLLRKNLKLAASVCKKFKSELDWKKLLNPLAREYFRTKDVDSFALIIEQINDDDFGKEILQYSIQKNYNNTNKDALSSMIRVLEKHGFQTSNNLSDTSSFSIERLDSAGTKRNNNSPGMIPHPRDMSATELENHVIELKSKGMNTRGALRLLLQQYCRNKEVEKALQIKKELDSNGFEFSPGMKSSLLEIHMLAGQLDEAEKCLNELITNFPQFQVDNYKFLVLAAYMVNAGKYEPAVQLLRSLPCGKPNPSILKHCTRLLNTIADKKGPAETREVFNLLVEKNVCPVSNLSLGPLVGAYLKRNEYEKAVESFEEFAIKHKFTPQQSSLMIALIEKIEKLSSHSHIHNNETDVDEKNQNIYLNLLEKVCSTAANVHSMENTNVLLYIALAKVGAMNLIKKMFFDSSRKLNPAYLVKNCQRLADQNELETLRNITFTINNVTNIDAQGIYRCLLCIYIRRGDCDGALNLWTELQEKDVIVSEKFLGDLKDFLVINKREVPFSKTTKLPDLQSNSI